MESSGDWNCLQCGNLVDDGFDVCWACGARRDGVVDSEFVHADAYEPPLQADEKLQFSLGHLLRLVTAISFVFAFAGTSMAGRPIVLTAVLGLAGAGYFLLHAITWLVSRKFFGLQQTTRAEHFGSKGH